MRPVACTKWYLVLYLRAVLASLDEGRPLRTLGHMESGLGERSGGWRSFAQGRVNEQLTAVLRREGALCW